MIDITPEAAVIAAATAGWPACGVWFDADTWTRARSRAVRDALDATGTVALDIEPIIVTADGDHTDAVVAAGADIGARFVLFTSRVDDWPHVIDRFGHACDRAAEAGLTVVCEFLPIFPLATLRTALHVVEAAARPNGGVLVDNLHLRSSGATPADLAGVDRKLLPYLQLADAPAVAPLGTAALVAEALDHRRWPGEGELPVDELLAAVADVPISYEVRSRAMRETFPDPLERARHGWRAIERLRAGAATGGRR
jgi:sugar phosphate isomerase/epimerase